MTHKPDCPKSPKYGVPDAWHARPEVFICTCGAEAAEVPKEKDPYAELEKDFDILFGEGLPGEGICNAIKSFLREKTVPKSEHKRILNSGRKMYEEGKREGKRIICYKEDCDSTVAVPVCSKHAEEEREKTVPKTERGRIIKEMVKFIQLLHTSKEREKTVPREAIKDFAHNVLAFLDNIGRYQNEGDQQYFEEKLRHQADTLLHTNKEQ